jgi:hypothetical protein
MDIPFIRLQIPPALQANLAESAPHAARLALARGVLPVPVETQLGICYVLATHADPYVAGAARKTLVDLPLKLLLPVVGGDLHPKVLEFLAEFRPQEAALDERLMRNRHANDRTACLIARRADPDICEMLGNNQERLLLTPETFLELANNPNCPGHVLLRAEGFLRMHKALPAGAPSAASVVARAASAAPVAPAPVGPAAPVAVPMDLEAEIDAALRGEQSPSLLSAQSSALGMFDVDDTKAGANGFRFDFSDDDAGFSWNLTEERDGREDFDPDETINIERMIADLSVGKRIKLAYLGNKQVRAVLIRDQNSIVSIAVVKSGRLTDGEVVAYAANRNMGDDVIRELAMNREFVRRYPVKVALVNNPKTPPSVAMAFVSTLQKKDLQNLARNRNVPSVIFQQAARLYKTKFRDA